MLGGLLSSLEGATACVRKRTFADLGANEEHHRYGPIANEVPW